MPRRHETPEHPPGVGTSAICSRTCLAAHSGRGVSRGGAVAHPSIDARGTRGEEQVPKGAKDHCYIMAPCTPVLCLKCSRTGVVAAHAIQSKDAVPELVRMRPIVVEDSPEYASQANGVGERCVQTSRGGVSWSALEGCIDEQMPDDHHPHTACEACGVPAQQVCTTSAPMGACHGRESQVAARARQWFSSASACPSHERQWLFGAWMDWVASAHESHAGMQDGSSERESSGG